MIFPGKLSGFYFVVISPDGVLYDRMQIGKLLQKLGLEIRIRPEKIVQHENLSVAIRPRSDSDGRNTDLFAYFFPRSAGIISRTMENAPASATASRRSFALDSSPLP